MRSSKSRSRSKQNRPRTIGNIVNRVFDSSGPEGKVRGTPQQIIEKYQALARDAQLSNDRVAAENFLQHAEHYTRMLGEATRELAAEQEARRQHQGSNGHNGDRGYQPRRDDRDDEQPDVAPAAYGFVEMTEEGDSALVETPEARVEQPAREHRFERRRDDNRRDENRRDDNRRDENRRFDNRRDERREDNRRDERRDEPREVREDRPREAREERPREERPREERTYKSRAPRDEQPRAPREEQPRRSEEPRVEEAVVAAPAPRAEETSRPVLRVEKPRAEKPRAEKVAASVEAAVEQAAPSIEAGVPEAAEKPKRARAPRKPRVDDVKTEVAE